MNTDNFYKPSAFWSWNGEITPDGVRRQVKMFAQAGMGSFFIHARGGLKIGYLGEEWFACARAAIEQAEACGLDVWLYDENGWPSGFGGGAVNGLGAKYQMKRLRRTSAEYPDVLVRCGGMDISMVTEPGYVDLLDPDVTREFIRSTHEKYRQHFSGYFGRVIKGIFTDEPQLDNAGLPYSETLPDAFEKAYGYPLLPSLYMLFEDADGAEKFRYDYFSLVNRLFVQNFTGALAEWCSENGLLLTGHFPCEEDLSYQTCVTGGVMTHYPVMDMPGIDHLGRRYESPVTVKQLTSVKEIFGKPFVLSETFGGAGHPVSFREFAHMWAYQAVLGVNFCCMHLSAYTLAGIPKRDYPPAISYQQPWWKKAGYLFGEIEMLNRTVSAGESVSDVLLVSPLRSAYLHRLGTDKQNEISDGFRRTIENLLALQLPFEIADERFLPEATVRKGRICLGKRAFRVLILPHMSGIDSATLSIARKFVASGGSVFYTGEAPGFLDGAQSGIPAKEYRKFRYVFDSREKLGRALAASGYKYPVRVMRPDGEDVAVGVYTNIRKTENGYIVLAFNSDLSAEKEIVLECEGNMRVEVQDIAGGEKKRLPAVQRGGKTYCRDKIGLFGYRIYSFGKGRETVHTRPELAELYEAKVLRTERSDLNTLVIDAASCDYEEYRIRHPIERLREEVLRSHKKFTLRYTFDTAEMPSELYICCERSNAGNVWLNGIRLDKQCGTLYDEGIVRLDAAGALRTGKNFVDIRYETEGAELLADGQFETMRNKFDYAVAIENLIVAGRFDVEAKSAPDKGGACGYALEGGFALRKESEPDAGDFMRGMPFYAGAVAQELNFFCGEGVPSLLLRGMKATVAEVFVNGVCAGAVSGGECVLPVAGLSRKGENTLRVVYYNSLRNVFGPFHHYKGDPMLVSPDAFSGKRGYFDAFCYADAPEDISVPEYRFTEFSPARIYICLKK